MLLLRGECNSAPRTKFQGNSFAHSLTYTDPALRDASSPRKKGFSVLKVILKCCALNPDDRTLKDGLEGVGMQPFSAVRHLVYLKGADHPWKGVVVVGWLPVRSRKLHYT